MSEETQIALFRGKEVRKTLHQGEWWFVISDIIIVLTDSRNPTQYLKNIRRRDSELSLLFDPVDKGEGQIEPPLALKIKTAGGMQKLLCWSTPGILRLIQSIPSPKAEPFKRWLAKVGYERIQEIEDPELATKRIRETYEAKGYSKDWIDKRVRGIAVRDELTSEWKQRGVKEGKDYAILTNEISKATFGLTATEYKKYKGLQRENLRDHMGDLELIFTMLGEAATTEITRNKDAQGFWQNKDAAQRGGKIAGDARHKLEQESGRKVVTKQNYLDTKTARKLPS